MRSSFVLCAVLLILSIVVSAATATTEFDYEAYNAEFSENPAQENQIVGSSSFLEKDYSSFFEKTSAKQLQSKHQQSAAVSSALRAILEANRDGAPPAKAGNATGKAKATTGVNLVDKIGTRVLLIGSLDEVTKKPSTTHEFAADIFNAAGIYVDELDLQRGNGGQPVIHKFKEMERDPTAIPYFGFVITSDQWELMRTISDATRAMASKYGIRMVNLAAAPPFNEEDHDVKWDGYPYKQPKFAARGFTTNTQEFKDMVISFSDVATSWAGNELGRNGMNPSWKHNIITADVTGDLTIHPVMHDPKPNQTFEAVPLLLAECPEWGKGNPVTLMAVHKYKDGREELHVFISQLRESLLSSMAHPVWLQWFTRGLHTGARRVHLSTQIDDFFMSTDWSHPEVLKTQEFGPYAGSLDYTVKDGGLPKEFLSKWDTVKGEENKSAPYRVNSYDMYYNVVFMESINKKMPKGSDFTIELVFNGEAVLENAAKVDCKNEIYDAEKDPKGRPDYEKDKLYKYMKNKVQDLFYWVSHTWSHQDLTCDHRKEERPDKCHFWDNPTKNKDFMTTTSHDKVKNEIMRNKKWADIFFEKQTNRHWIYSPHGLVPPGITGLFNPKALSGLYDAGIFGVVGDNSRTGNLSRYEYEQNLHNICTDMDTAHMMQARDDLVNHKSRYHAMYSSAGHNGWGTGERFGSMIIMPRHALDIAYDCNNDQQELALFNYIHTTLPMEQGQKPDYPIAQNVSVMMERMAPVSAKQLLTYNLAPFMFHQGNLRAFPWNKNRGFWPLVTAPLKLFKGPKSSYVSLLSLWVQYVYSFVGEASVLPVNTLKFDEQTLGFIERRARDECGIEAHWLTDKSKSKGNDIYIKGVELKTKGHCLVPLSGFHADSFINKNKGHFVFTELDQNDQRVVKPGNDNRFRMRYGPERSVFVRMEPAKIMVIDFDDSVCFAGCRYTEHIPKRNPNAPTLLIEDFLQAQSTAEKPVVLASLTMDSQSVPPTKEVDYYNNVKSAMKADARGAPPAAAAATAAAPAAAAPAAGKATAAAGKATAVVGKATAVVGKAQGKGKGKGKGHK